MDDIRNVTVRSSNGTPVLLGELAEVSVGHQPRLGIAGQDDDDDIVQGIILMRRGEQSLPTLQRVKAEIAKINRCDILPPGVRVEKIYDRTELIELTIHTVLSAFQNVADTLRALQYDADEVKAQAAAEYAAGESLELARQALRLGSISYRC